MISFLTFFTFGFFFCLLFFTSFLYLGVTIYLLLFIIKQIRVAVRT